MKKQSLFFRILSVVLASVILSSASFTVFAERAGNTTSSDLVFAPSGSGKIEYTIVDMDEGIIDSRFSVAKVPNGIKIILTAVETGDSFMYWLDNNTGRVLSFNKSYSFTLASAAYIYAVFASHTDANHNVSYLNYAGKELYAQEVKLGTSITAPTDTYLPGFTFVGWDKSPAEVRNDKDFIIVRPIYKLNDANYSVNISNSSGVSGAGSYSAFDTVKIVADAKNSSGASFSYWKDSSGKIVSYDRVYKFKINYNASFTAVYGESVTASPLTRITWADANSLNRKITFYAERCIPEDYTVLQHGIILTNSAEIAAGSNFTVKNSNVLKGIGTTAERLGLYSLAKKDASPGDTWYARSYIICEENGSQFVYYSDVFSQTL